MDENKNLILDSIAKKRGSPLIIQLVVSCNCPPVWHFEFENYSKLKE